MHVTSYCTVLGFTAMLLKHSMLMTHNYCGLDTSQCDVEGRTVSGSTISLIEVTSHGTNVTFVLPVPPRTHRRGWLCG